MPAAHRCPALAALLLGACATDLPHQWIDPVLGCRVHSDFAELRASLLFSGELQLRSRALCAVFGVASLPDLDVYVHDQRGRDVGADARLAGWHDGGEIHLLAAWNGPGPDLPDPASARHFGHELVHALLRRTGLKPPRWLEEGLCELLSAAPVESHSDSDGRLVAMPHGAREREVRRLRAQGRWLPADALLALRDSYPEDPAQLAPMYAAATSFAWFLLRDRPTLDRGGIDALLALDDATLRARHREWSLTLDTAVSALLEPFAAAPDAAVRRTLAEQLGPPDGDGAWWRVALALLTDADQRVRIVVRRCCVYLIALDDGGREQAAAWARSDDMALRRAGQLALAQNGDLDAAIAFCRELDRGIDDALWEPLLWLALLLPGTDGKRQPTPALEISGDRARLVQYAAGLADAYAAARGRVQWDATAQRWRLPQ